MITSFRIRTSGWLIGEAVFLVALVWSLLLFADSTEALEDSRLNQVLCQRLAMEIKTLRGLGSIAEDEQTSSSLGNTELVKLALESGIAENNVTSIQRLVPLAIQETDYHRHDVAIELKNVTMQQVLKLAIAAERQRGTVLVTSIRLGSQRRSRRSAEVSETELWKAELILTQLVFSARSAKR